MIEIFEATANDIKLIQEITYKTWPITYGRILPATQLEYMLEMMYSKEALEKQMYRLNHHFLLAKREDQHLGFVSYENFYKREQQTKIHKIYILPAAQGLGAGRRLMEVVASIALDKGDKKLLLNVNKYNEAEKFYAHLGFEVIGTEDIDIGSGFLMEDKIMMKQLV